MLKYFFALFFLSACANAFSPKALLGPKECSWGPSFWCKSITNAKNCNAVKHCIQTVWEHQKPVVADKDDDICSLCKAMVSDARNQLESNETLDMIKDVFERTCKLMKLKPVVKECIKFADEYSVELVEMLSSYMSPDMICALAGLCSSAGIDKMYDEDVYNKKLREEERNAELQKDCEPCMDLADHIADVIDQAMPEEVKQFFMRRCNHLGSLTFACTNIIDNYIVDMYKKIKADYTPTAFCYLTSACINGYGRKIQVKTESDSGVIHVNKDAVSIAVKHLSDDQTCELCKTMAKHLKDLLVSNTTKMEFKEMLRGICKQTGRFQRECLYLTEQYYDRVYRYLVTDFNAKDACIFVSLCEPPASDNSPPTSEFISPFSLEEHEIGSISIPNSELGFQIFTPILYKPVKVEISYGDPLESKYQLPVERIVIPQTYDLDVNNRESCMFCQYLLHYIQKVISQPYGVYALKEVVDKVCDQLPQSITLQCKNFVQEFGDAFVAILAQEIDPSQVCPALRACPFRMVGEKFVTLDLGRAPGCPLCLMVVEDITEKLKDNKTEDAIRKALHNLCERMPKSLESQCNEFVQKYAEEVVDMMLANFTPQEVCTYLKICHTKVDVELVAPDPEEKHEILTNEIPRGEGEVEAKVEVVEKKNNQPMCFLCEFVMDKIKDQLKDNETEEEVKRIVLGVCKSIPKAIESDCRDFVLKYSKYIVEMLENDVDPRMVCREMHMCKEMKEPAYMDHVIRSVEECAICEALVGAVRGLLEDKNFDRNMSRHAVKICYSISFLRPSQMDRCRSMVLSYGPSIINLLVELGVRPELVCSRLQLCDETEQAKVHLTESSTEVPESHPQNRPHLLGGNSCTWGPSYWCQSEDHAKECGTLAHCREVVWKADKPTPAA